MRKEQPAGSTKKNKNKCKPFINPCLVFTQGVRLLRGRFSMLLMSCAQLPAILHEFKKTIYNFGVFLTRPTMWFAMKAYIPDDINLATTESENSLKLTAVNCLLI